MGELVPLDPERTTVQVADGVATVTLAGGAATITAPESIIIAIVEKRWSCLGA